MHPLTVVNNNVRAKLDIFFDFESATTKAFCTNSLTLYASLVAIT
jgi:hypothetical protein